MNGCGRGARNLALSDPGPKSRHNLVSKSLYGHRFGRPISFDEMLCNRLYRRHLPNRFAVEFNCVGVGDIGCVDGRFFSMFPRDFNEGLALRSLDFPCAG